ncbi:hypothetical protein [Helicobacter pylori]|uniref:hypothetical protein n=1 Tax=Helicobacter pylori TaxID=210 RepID=UPI002159DEB7|nr:hypothetical protein [Helicobacter pylori]
MRNQKLRFSSFFEIVDFLFKALTLFIFESLKCFLKSFHSLKSCLSVTLLARFNKDQLIF